MGGDRTIFWYVRKDLVVERRHVQLGQPPEPPIVPRSGRLIAGVQLFDHSQVPLDLAQPAGSLLVHRRELFAVSTPRGKELDENGRMLLNRLWFANVHTCVSCRHLKMRSNMDSEYLSTMACVENLKECGAFRVIWETTEVFV